MSQARRKQQQHEQQSQEHMRPLGSVHEQSIANANAPAARPIERAVLGSGHERITANANYEQAS